MFNFECRLKKKIENEEDKTPFELSTEKLMLRSIERGLPLVEWENMTPGMIIDYIIEYNNEHLSEDEREDSIIMATQSDYDRF